MKLDKRVLPVICLMSSATALAGINDIRDADNQISLQSISTSVTYTEVGNGIFGTQTGVLDTETGSVPGFALSLTTLNNDNLYFNAAYSQNNGHTNYTGALIGGGPYGSVVGQSSATLYDYTLRVGKSIIVSGETMVTPYGEIANHQWYRGVNYGETYTHNSLGIGILGQYSPVNQFVFSANALLGRTFGSYISVAGPLGFSADLGNSNLYKLGIAVDYAFTRNFHGNVGFDYTSFKYGMSAPTIVVVGGLSYYVWEPDSSTKYNTLKFGLGYAF